MSKKRKLQVKTNKLRFEVFIPHITKPLFPIIDIIDAGALSKESITNKDNINL
jgi:hypothetical protein